MDWKKWAGCLVVGTLLLFPLFYLGDYAQVIWVGPTGLVPVAAIVLGSLILSLILVPLVKLIARKFNILDVPDGNIKRHAVSTPYLGGLAVFVGTLIPSLVLVPVFGISKDICYFLYGCTILLIVGLIDDIIVLRPSQKLLGQCVAVGFFLYGGFYLHIFGPYLGIVLSGLWILTIINAFNLIDVMDGLASLVGLCAAAGFMLIAAYLGDMFLCLFASFAAALGGFLVYNWPPASIYLGDAGSLLIGGFLGALPLKMNLGKVSPLGYFAPLILLAIPIFELVSLIVIRTYKKIPFYKASPHHFSILLQNYGWSKEKILKAVALTMLLLIAVAYSIFAGFINILAFILLLIVLLNLF